MQPAKYLLLICITAFLAAGIYIYKPISGTVAALSDNKPCSEPMSFEIGTIDPGFSISKDDLLAAVLDASATWNSGSDHDLVIHNSDVDNPSDIVVNLVYDERQKRTDAELRFREQIRTAQIRLDQLQEQHEQRRERFHERTQAYLQLSERTARKVSELNEWVTEKNDGGGFTESEYEVFKQRKEEVNQNQEEVLSEKKQLDQMAKTINREMDDLNKKFEKNNKLIDRYNEEFAGDMRFTKATYHRTGNRGIITVNQFMNKRELQLILAHEMGHALGLNHLSNPKSVMFNRMGGQDLYPIIQLTKEDRQAAEAICQ